jgi:two-component system LytT family response regulator
MMNCVAIDDEPLALTQLTGYISRMPNLNLVASCKDAVSAMKALSTQKVDLLFVDINMPDLNGIDLVRILSDRPLVIFTTAYSEYAVEGFKVDAIDYLLKPFDFKAFAHAVDKAFKWWQFKTGNMGGELSFNDGTLFVKNDYRATRVRLDDIKYIEGMSEYVRIYVENEEKALMPLLSMKRLEELLPPTQFMRVHRSYIVNLSKVIEISRFRIVFGETYVPIGDNYKDKFMDYINSRMIR